MNFYYVSIPKNQLVGNELTALFRHDRFAIIIIGLFCLLSLGVAARPLADKRPLTMAVHPYLPYEELIRRYSPLAEYLRKKTGHAVTLEIGRDYSEHQVRVGRDKVDIAFMGPAVYVRVRERYGPKPLLARLEVQGQPYLKGAIITHRDSSLKNLTALKNRNFAFGDAESTMSHLMPRYMLQRVGISLKELGDHQYLGSHTNVALGVLAGDFDAGGVKQEIYEHYKEKGLRVLAWSPRISEHLFLTRGDLPGATIEALRTALLTLHESEQGKLILSGIKNGVSALVPVVDSDYDPLREMLETLPREQQQCLAD